MSSGFSAIVAALLLGKRRGLGKEPMPPHSLPLCLIGAGSCGPAGSGSTRAAR
jgi:Amt family ammonium transporter